MTSSVIVALAFAEVVVQTVFGVPVQPTNASTLPVALALSETEAPTLNVNVPQTTPAVGVGPVTEHVGDWPGGEKPSALPDRFTV